ncbi:MAG: cytochrome c3 family protein [Chloroflexota bacterium]
MRVSSPVARTLGFGVLAGLGVALFFLVKNPALVRAQPLAQPTVPHAIEGRTNCLTCHVEGGAKATPANHKGRGNETCLACHRAAAAPTAPAPTAPAGPTAEPPAARSPDQACLACHNNLELSTTLSDGSKLSLFIDTKNFYKSVHGGGDVSCADCHVDIKGYPHPKLQARNKRDYALTAYQLCRKCHLDNYTRTLDSMHAKVLAGGNFQAPVCTDCHSAHYVTPPNKPRRRISDTCGTCHSNIYFAYGSSVHGKALLEESNVDVPVCTDCHGVHNIHDPRVAVFRVGTPEMCSRCHSDERLMGKYKISTQVFQTYLADFHGVTVSLVKAENPNIWTYKAVCTDCHGVHDIKQVDDPTSSVVRQNLVKTCRKCHPDVTENFPAAWTSHYQPNRDRYALVYYVNLFYKIFIPVTIGGMMVFIVLDYVRSIVNRRRKV